MAKLVLLEDAIPRVIMVLAIVDIKIHESTIRTLIKNDEVLKKLKDFHSNLSFL